MKYVSGDLVTVEPADSDPWIMHMQRHVRIAEERPGGYMIRLDGAGWDYQQHGPVPVARLKPGWVEQDGRTRVDRKGRRR